MPTGMPLEEIGLLHLLEKINVKATATIDRFARYGLVEGGLITDEDPPGLTACGHERLAELRAQKTRS